MPLTDGNYYRDPNEDGTNPDPEPEAKSVSLNCRVTPSMRESVERAARESGGMIMGDWLRAVVGSALEMHEWQMGRGPAPAGMEDEDVASEPEVASEQELPSPQHDVVAYAAAVSEAAIQERQAVTGRSGVGLDLPAAPASKYRFPNPRECPHHPTWRQAAGRCGGCGSKLGLPGRLTSSIGGSIGRY